MPTAAIGLATRPRSTPPAAFFGDEPVGELVARRRSSPCAGDAQREWGQRRGGSRPQRSLAQPAPNGVEQPLLECPECLAGDSEGLGGVHLGLVGFEPGGVDGAEVGG